MRYLKIIFLNMVIISLFSVKNLAQNKEKEISALSNIYANLEYNTLAFNDLKKKWIVSDPLLIRDVFNRFLVKNALRKNGKEFSIEEVKNVADEIQNGNVIIFLRKRYYDNEIEYFAFLPFSEIYKKSPHLLADSVTDGFYLKDVIGDALYRKLQNKSYFFSTITKKIFEVRAGYYFKIFLDLMKPEIMFWSTTSKQRNKYLVSFFGKWGNDNIVMPSYYLRSYIMGLRLTYYNVISTNPEEYSYKLSLGLGFPSNVQYTSQIASNDKFFHSGTNIYIALSGQPLQQIYPKIRNLFMDLELSYTMFDYKYKNFGLSSPLTFYAIKNYFTFKVSKKNIFNVFGLGMLKFSLGVSTHDINKLQLNPAKQKVVDLEPNKSFIQKFSHFILTSVGIERFGGLLSYNFNIDYFHNFNYSASYLGFNLEFLISDNIGFDIRYYKAMNDVHSNIGWRNNYYFVFSPVLKINY